MILGINKKLIWGLGIGACWALAFSSVAFSQAQKAAAAKQLKVTGAKLLVDDFEKASKNNLWEAFGRWRSTRTKWAPR